MKPNADGTIHIEQEEKAPCKECGAIAWEYARMNDKGDFVQCDQCHIWDSQKQSWRRRLHS